MHDAAGLTGEVYVRHKKSSRVTMVEDLIEIDSAIVIDGPQNEFLGINKIYYGKSYFDDFKRYCGMKEKLSEIKILCTSGPGLFRRLELSIKNALNKHATVKVILSTPDTDYVREFCRMEMFNSDDKKNHPPERIKEEIENAEAVLKNAADNSKSGKIYLGHFKTQFRANITIIDREIAFYTPILPPRFAQDGMTLVLDQGQILEDCAQHFDVLFSILEEDGMIVRVK